MKKIKIKRLLAFLPAIIIMIIIFCFSAKTGSESSTTSEGVVKRMMDAFVEISGLEIKGEDYAEIANALELPVRKAAHMIEYAVLSLSLFFPIYINLYINIEETRSKRRLTMAICISALLSVLYAASDEIHQLYVPGRSGRATDVLIDSVGIALMLFIVYIIGRNKVNNKQNI